MCNIREFMIYKLQLDHNAVEETINICGSKDEGTVDNR